MASLNWTRIALHIIFWLVYLPINAIISCLLRRANIAEEFGMALVGEAFSLPVKLIFTYFVFYYIIPLYLERSKLWQLVGLLLLAFIAATFLYRLEIGWVFFPIFAPGVSINLFSFQGLLLTVFDLFITLAAAVTIKMIRMHYKSLEFEKQLIREKLQSELNFLRAQTNPHFLFNTLNNLYVLARKKSEKTPDAIMMLSKIMRFVIYECRAPRIALEDEAKVIKDFIELEKLRYNLRLTVEYREDVDQPLTPIAPLLLLPFVENSFKHGAGSTTGEVHILILLTLRNRELSFTVKNTVDKDAKEQSRPGGIGLQNLKRQLDLLYPGQYEMNTGLEDGYFEAQLTLHLQEERNTALQAAV
ncbi:MAG: histidine kinase [Lewinellaceae bacterium]|nr:histidine kinase [Saprospiraceae bacterium]MCB0543636.1 histidine kinase [Saprospiraceae bacterium]MCB9306239.1 histidine kinase [Lewinellaceae bacterium]MCB9354908.1 histidine kinase [Lewinellaceae bacterium]